MVTQRNAKRIINGRLNPKRNERQKVKIDHQTERKKKKNNTLKEKTIGAPTSIINAFHKIAKDRKVIPDPIDDRKFQE